MIWEHRVDKLWLQARQGFLTASEVRKLVPLTSSGNPRKVSDSDRIKILSGKMHAISDDDCVSTGAAARGHLLEPYAIDKFNMNTGHVATMMHWDDVLIVNTGLAGGMTRIGFSPDACSCSQPEAVIVEADEAIPTGTEILEVKSYYPERHLIAGCTDPDDLEERWQIAVAMEVAPQIKSGSIAFFNPSMNRQLYYITYDRGDLSAERAIVREVADEWDDFLDKFADGAFEKLLCVMGSSRDELAIIDEIAKSKGLNP